MLHTARCYIPVPALPLGARHKSRTSGTLHQPSPPLAERHVRRYRRARMRMVAAPEVERGAVRVAQTTFEVVVIGAGPAGLSLSAALGRRGVHTLCVDPTLHKLWPNNYGTWLDELEPLGLADCASHVWDTTTVFSKKSDEKTSLRRKYVRIDRDKLKRRLLQTCNNSKCAHVCKAIAKQVDTSSTAVSTVTIKSLEDIPFLGALAKDTEMNVSAKIVVDATGHQLRFVQVDAGKVPGYQAAYGIDCDLEEKMHPYSADEMLLMDYRDDHMHASEADRRDSQQVPTFLYVMPLDNGRGRRVFLEETSLVAAQAVDFEKLKQRLYKRLNFYNIHVKTIHEVEHSLIPMGGEKPNLDQRTVAFGGAAAFVHPGTGYMIARALTLADHVAEGISKELKTGDSADEVSKRIWHLIWNDRMVQQRDFLNYGGEFLQKLDLDASRDFFTAFFKLSCRQWAAFLSFGLEEPMERLMFALNVFVHTSNRVRAWLIWDSVNTGGLRFFRSVLPFPTGKSEK